MASARLIRSEFQDLRSLEIKEISKESLTLKCLDLMASIQLQSLSVKHRKKSSVKHSMVKPILINFVNFSTIFCPGLSEKMHYHL